MSIPREAQSNYKKIQVEEDEQETSSSSEEESCSDDTPKKSPRKAAPKPSESKSNFTMIVKPDCMSQGKGIFLTRNVDDIPANEVFVVQEYMLEPYLIDELKFDLRLYVLILSCDPLKIFLYQDGIVRFATKKYKPLC